MKSRYLIVGSTSAIIIGLVFVSFFNFYYRASTFTANIITDDVKKLAMIFNAINRQCRILGFDHVQNPINFLNVEKFSGSEVGSMNLAYPEKWEGPYLYDNPTVQNKEYMVVSTESGYFITPGDGVKLPNDKVIGSDIIFDKKSDLIQMMYDKTQLYYRGNPLAARVMGQNNYSAQSDIARLEE